MVQKQNTPLRPKIGNFGEKKSLPLGNFYCSQAPLGSTCMCPRGVACSGLRELPKWGMESMRRPVDLLFGISRYPGPQAGAVSGQCWAPSDQFLLTAGPRVVAKAHTGQINGTPNNKDLTGGPGPNRDPRLGGKTCSNGAQNWPETALVRGIWEYQQVQGPSPHPQRALRTLWLMRARRKLFPYIIGSDRISA